MEGGSELELGRFLSSPLKSLPHRSHGCSEGTNVDAEEVRSPLSLRWVSTRDKRPRKRTCCRDSSTAPRRLLTPVRATKQTHAQRAGVKLASQRKAEAEEKDFHNKACFELKLSIVWQKSGFILHLAEQRSESRSKGINPLPRIQFKGNKSLYTCI